jgi:hypothetical protein
MSAWNRSVGPVANHRELCGRSGTAAQITWNTQDGPQPVAEGVEGNIAEAVDSIPQTNLGHCKAGPQPVGAAVLIVRSAPIAAPPRKSRSMGPMPPGLIAAMLVAAALLAGCGSSSAPRSAPAVTASRLDEAFITKVDSWCTQTLQSYQVTEGTFPVQGFDPLHPDPVQLPRVGRFFAQGSTVRDRIPEELAALGEPGTGAAKWDRLRDDLVHYTSLAHTQIAAALAANAPAFAAAAAQVRNLSNKIHAAGIGLGFRADSSCADLF